MNKKQIVLGIVLGLSLNGVQAAAVNGQGTWESTLQARDLDGNASTAEAWYDTVLNITWLADADAGAGSTFDHGVSAFDGLVNWASANAWAAALDVNGVTGWRLPHAGPINGSTHNDTYAFDGSTDYGYNVSAPGTIYAGSIESELAHLFFNTLGNLASYAPSGRPQAFSGLTNTGPFENVEGQYWSGTEYSPNPLSAWFFRFDIGIQDYSSKTSATWHAWAVHDGDVGTPASVVPVPAAAWLFGSAIIGLVGWARRKA